MWVLVQRHSQIPLHGQCEKSVRIQWVHPALPDLPESHTEDLRAAVYDPTVHTCCENNYGGLCTTHDQRLIPKNGNESCCVGQQTGVHICSDSETCCSRFEAEAVCCSKVQQCGGTGHDSQCIAPTAPPAPPSAPPPTPVSPQTTCNGPCSVNTDCGASGECGICSPKPGSSAYWCTALCGGKCSTDAHCGVVNCGRCTGGKCTATPVKPPPAPTVA